ncbi:CBF/Mak21 family-domain-containing protein [Lophiotrema nucula]|uniref:CBF/Mak21 family-domain-containing protein n=1 Tax=Lophiotrema nucula TaxID=690887 RepID=A0A6A5YG16_9PLEO|nr:CBF/Mak21 family-domain-containing protein [Lophiotrema nucula]
MGKKRTHAETKDGFTKPPPDKDRMSHRKEHKDKDKRKNGEVKAQKPALLFTPQPEWHTVALPELPSVENPTIPPRHVIDALHQYADALLEEEATKYSESHMAQDSSRKFLSTIMASGTMEDKVSALTLLVQESPLHTMKAFEQLLGLSRKKSRNQALMALAALKDLLGQGVVLPPDRKLRVFARQPGLIAVLQGKNVNWKSGDRLPGHLQKVHLIAWAYEDWLKKQYFEMLKVIEGWCNDEVEYSRNRSVSFVWELLKEKPEQEENLLRLLINKLGDKEKKVASKASYLLLQLQVTHPLMKSVIINAIESDLLFKPNQSAHAKYYAIITLNQTVCSVKEPEVANKLLEIYFSLFVGLLKKEKEREDEEKKTNKHGQLQGGGSKPGKMARKKAEKAADEAYKAEDEMREKLVAAVLTGVNRAFPFAKTDDDKFEQQLNTIFEVTHSSNFNTSIQAMMLIQQISATKHISSDRFYRTLYESLLDPRLLTTSKHIMYLNLLYRALKADVSIKRVKAFVKRLLQIIHLHEPPFICGVLYLIKELIATTPSIRYMLDKPEDNASDSEDEHFEDVPEGAVVTNGTTPSKGPRYDPRKRDPDHAHADLSCLWELLPLQAHYHPSVHVLATKLLEGSEIKEKPDPTVYTLMNFLDKFAFRNPKTKKEASHGTSIMQPMSGTSKAADYLISQRGSDKTHDPVNSEQFWRKKMGDVREDEAFFHTYFEKAGKAKQVKKKEKKKRKDEEEESEESGEEEIWKALVNSRPEIEGDEEEDSGFSDIDMDGMMSDDDTDGGLGMDEGVELNLGSDDEDMDDLDTVHAPAKTKSKSKQAKVEEDDDDMDDEGFDIDDDEEAFVDSDDEIPVDFDMNDDTDLEEPPPTSSKASKDDKKGNKKRKLKHLPTFASAEDYAKLIGDDSD